MAWRVGAKGSRRAQGWGATPGPQRGAELGLHSCSGQGDPTAGTPRALPGRGALICSGLGAARGGSVLSSFAPWAAGGLPGPSGDHGHGDSPGVTSLLCRGRAHPDPLAPLPPTSLHPHVPVLRQPRMRTRLHPGK